MHVGDARLRRGTPVYVRGNADVVEVQRVMALKHIRHLPVIEGDRIIGIVDLMDIAALLAREGDGGDLLGRPA